MNRQQYSDLIDIAERIRHCAEYCTERARELKDKPKALESELQEAYRLLRESNAYLNCHTQIANFLQHNQVQGVTNESQGRNAQATGTEGIWPRCDSNTSDIT